MDIHHFSKEYLRFLNNDLKGLNLTRILEEEEFYNKQILDSILPLSQSVFFNKNLANFDCIVDIGFGGGFPLIPLAQEYRDLRFLGVESIKKKVEAVKKISQYFKQKNVSFYNGRIENLLIDRSALLLFKAVGPMKKMLSLLNYSSEIYCGFYKGPNLIEKEGHEIKEIKSKWSIIECLNYKLPNGDSREFYLFKNKFVPHRTMQSLDFKEKLDFNRCNAKKEKTNTRVKLSDFL